MVKAIDLPEELLAEVQSRTVIATNVEGGALIHLNENTNENSNENTSVLLQNIEPSLIEPTDLVSRV
ncbi:hypothetical protein [Baaleninema sp.]|uniref:hypothetical protein n=1 Tax=Baaleninema sp. TaxID=3101197 RepID=UPI003D01E072